MIESTIDGRYQVITRIASGGMGEVYRAQDAVLEREVALKILHAHLAGDRGFVERFRREARAAAILNHRNIVGVYDWGSTDGTYFMVMEFVRGHNLRSLITEFGRFESGQVAEIAVQVLGALEHAHGHGIVHRDIKPENILIGGDGILKVADFGLARAFADAFVSQAEGTVTGTVQYLAPEQIQGEPATPRTDLYSLGAVLFELLTGRPPYGGETSLAIAYQHLSSRIPPPSAVEPSVPKALDEVVLYATEKEPAARPPSARALRDRIVEVATRLPGAPGMADLAARVSTSEFLPEERAVTVTIPRAESPRRRRIRLIRRIAATAIVLVTLAASGWATWLYAVPHYADVPGVRGLSVQQATARLEDAGFRPEIGRQIYSTDVGVGLVVRTEPPAAARARTGATVVLILSKGPELFPVPQVVGDREADARRKLTDAGFEVATERERHETVPRGRVIQQNPSAGQEIRRGSRVLITVSIGPPLVVMPDLEGRPASTAERELTVAGFVVDRSEEHSVVVAEGNVIRTEPPAGRRIPLGSTVTMVVSLGPRTFPMPNVQGLTRNAAVELLEALGLVVNVTVIPGSFGDAVVGQLPRPGTTVEEGQQVTIYVLAP